MRPLTIRVHHISILRCGFAGIFLAAATLSAQSPKPFTLQQILSAPYASLLTAAPTGNLFAWTEDAEGRHNLFVGGKDIPARQLTLNTEDDAQDISQLAWSPDANYIAYTFGAPSGADGKPANPAHLQRPTPVEVIVQPIDGTAPTILGEGRSPLFTRDGKSLIFIRGGQIFTSCLMDCHPERSEGPALVPPLNSPHQLVFDRGTASQLTLSPDGQTLAFISRRRETNEPSHAFLALFNLATHTLTFPSPSTANDSAPAFSPDGTQIAWLRTPFTEPLEFANPRTTPNPWSIQLLNLNNNLSHSPFTTDVSSGSRAKTEGSPTEVSSRPESSELHREDGAERPASSLATTSRIVFSPTPNTPGSVLPDPGGHDPYLLWTANDHIIFYSTADGWNHLYSINPSSSKPPTLVTPGEGEVEDVSLSPDRKEVLWASNLPMAMISYDGLTECMGPILGLQMADIDRRHLSSRDVTKPLAPEPQKLNPLSDSFTADSVRKTSGQGIETHPVPLADGSLIALASDSFVPMHPVYVAKDGSLTDARKQWLPKTYPQGALVFPEEVSIPFPDDPSASKAAPLDADKQMLHAQLFLPENTKAGGKDPFPWCNGHKSGPPEKNPVRHPAILFLHGGPMRQMLLGYPPMDYYSNAYAMNQYLTSRGFIVLSVNYRCGIGYGLAFHQCEHEGATGAAEYNDVLAARKYLASRPDVDTKRIGLWGGSYGGYLTALALSRNSDIFAAGVDFHGVHDWNLEDNASDWKQGTFAQQDAIAAKALASSPLADVTKWHSPVLFIHGDNDPDVAYAQTPHLADALRTRNAALPTTQQVDIEELIFPDELHGFLLHRDWLAAYTAAATFFERTLKP